MTLYSILRARCGLSIREAAAYHASRVDTVKSWSSGRNTAPPGVISELRELYHRIVAAGTEMAATADGVPAGGVIKLRVASDDAAAQRLGWPCVGAHAAAVGIAAALIDREVDVIVAGG